jgi:hypothetical protein
VSLEEDLSALVGRTRVYAPLREGGTKGQKELGVLKDLLEGMEREGCAMYSQPELSPLDPPDCIARDSMGNLVAFEITEFVSQDAVQMNERARPKRGKRPTIDRMVMAAWGNESVIAQVGSLLGAKDEKKYLGGPFAEHIAVIHTDEPLLVRADAEKWLADTSFGPYRQLSSAYFLYSYEPDKGYPFQSLRFRAT